MQQLGTPVEFGLLLLTVVNREYCKKLLVSLPGQKHPEQYHKQKEETFHVLYGSIELELDGLFIEEQPTTTPLDFIFHYKKTDKSYVYASLSLSI